MQALGLVLLYQTDDQVNLYCGMLDGLAFLPLDMVHNGLAYVKDNAPHFIDYFDSTCHM